MDTLVLSATYEPMQRVGWKRAITLYVAGRVEVVAAYDDRFIRSVAEAWPLPSVVRFVSGLRYHSRRVVRFSRQNVWLRDRGRCQYCHRDVTLKKATYDHVLPRSRGGRTSWDNVVIACLACNQHKADRTPAEARMLLKLSPVRPRSLPLAGNAELAWREDMPEHWLPYLIHSWG